MKILCAASSSGAVGFFQVLSIWTTSVTECEANSVPLCPSTEVHHWLNLALGIQYSDSGLYEYIRETNLVSASGTSIRISAYVAFILLNEWSILEQVILGTYASWQRRKSKEH